MTVLAWDGETLAADRRAVNGSLARTVTKIFRIGSCLVGYCGDADLGAEMVEWFRAGAEPAAFPKRQADTGDSPLLVIRPGGAVERYERSHVPIRFHDRQFAAGSGRDFALAAMHLGRTAIEAVKVAGVFDVGCGGGIDVLQLEA